MLCGRLHKEDVRYVEGQGLFSETTSTIFDAPDVVCLILYSISFCVISTFVKISKHLCN